MPHLVWTITRKTSSFPQELLRMVSPRLRRLLVPRHPLPTQQLHQRLLPSLLSPLLPRANRQLRRKRNSSLPLLLLPLRAPRRSLPMAKSKALLPRTSLLAPPTRPPTRQTAASLLPRLSRRIYTCLPESHRSNLLWSPPTRSRARTSSRLHLPMSLKPSLLLPSPPRIRHRPLSSNLPVLPRLRRRPPRNHNLPQTRRLLRASKRLLLPKSSLFQPHHRPRSPRRARTSRLSSSRAAS